MNEVLARQKKKKRTTMPESKGKALAKKKPLKLSKQIAKIYDNVFKFGRKALGWGLFPLILYIGFQTEPQPT
jgi:hypothetical protein